MTCHILKDDSGNIVAIACTRGERKDSSHEVRKAVGCRKWKTCESCGTFNACQEHARNIFAGLDWKKGGR